MNHELARVIRNVRNRPEQPTQWWEATINQLTKEFELFLGERFCVDDRPTINLVDPSFSIWLWSIQPEKSFFSHSWSAVMGGGLIAEDRFVVTIDAFLFHQMSMARMVTSDGRSFIQFLFDAESGGWKYNDWLRDKWGEWEDVTFDQTD